jgi:hypothetical protein
MAAQQTLHLPKPEPVVQSPALEKNDLVLLAPTPELNPRNQILREIAERSNAAADMDAVETVDSFNDDGESAQEDTAPVETQENEITQETQAVETPTETPAEPAEQPSQFNPDQEYELTVNGRPMKVKGSQIIERGRMAIQKETAADQKLELASSLLQEVQAKLQAQPAPAVVPQQPAFSVTDEQLAEIIQYGTKEQAAQAIAELRRSGQSSEMAQQQMQRAIPQVINDQLAFHEAAKFVQDEYGDLLTDPYLKQLFFMKENSMRETGGVDGRGDRRSYKELYKEIGEDLRTHFNKPKTASVTPIPAPKTREEKVAAKSAAPSAPKLASARMEGAAEKKPLSREEVIQKMQMARGQRVA